jgi:TetR/AcrR family transcriptional regulator
VSRNPEQTQSTILRVATAEFAARGFDGARVDRIAAQCGLSKNMLYYYFGRKEDLFVAVLEHAYQKLRTRQGELSVQPSDPVAALRQLIRHTFSAFKDHPEVIRLLNEENLHKGCHIRRSKRVRPLYDPLLKTLQSIIDEGVTQGFFRKDIDVKTLYLSLSSLAYHYLSNQHTLEIALETDLASENARELWLEHVMEMIMRCCYLPSRVEDESGASGLGRAHLK